MYSIIHLNCWKKKKKLTHDLERNFSSFPHLKRPQSSSKVITRPERKKGRGKMKNVKDYATEKDFSTRNKHAKEMVATELKRKLL